MLDIFCLLVITLVYFNIAAVTLVLITVQPIQNVKVNVMNIIAIKPVTKDPCL